MHPLDRLPAVAGDLGYKYIIVQMTSGDYSRLLFRAATDLKFHKDILAKLQSQVARLDASASLLCLGGGFAYYGADRSQVSLKDRSTDFGREPDRELSAKMLSEARPELTVAHD